MRTKFIFVLFLLAMLVGKVAIAEDKKPEFTSVKSGEVVPYDGYIFTPEAIVKIYTKSEEDIRKLKTEYEYKLELSQIDIQRLNDLSANERRIQAKLLQDTIISKDQIIELRERDIKKLQMHRTLDKFVIAGSFIVGCIVTYTVVYNTIGLVK